MRLLGPETPAQCRFPPISITKVSAVVISVTIRFGQCTLICAGRGNLVHFMKKSLYVQPSPAQLAGAYLLRYAQEASWREDNRRASNGDQTYRIAGLAMKHNPSVDFTGYWQRHVHS